MAWSKPASAFQFVLEDYKLSDVLDDISKEDLRCLCLRYGSRSQRPFKGSHTCTDSRAFSCRGGVLCRIWRAVQRHRERQRSSDCAEEEGFN